MYDFHLYEVPGVVEFTETERTVVTRGWGERKMRSYCLMGIEFQFEMMKSSRDGQWYWLHGNECT